MSRFHPTPSAKVFLWIVSVVLVTVIYNTFRDERFLDLFRMLQRLTPSTTEENLHLIFPEDQYPRDEIVRSDGGLIQIIYQSPEQALRLRDLSGPFPSQVESCKEVPYLYAALIVSISTDGGWVLVGWRGGWVGSLRRKGLTPHWPRSFPLGQMSISCSKASEFATPSCRSRSSAEFDGPDLEG